MSLDRIPGERNSGVLTFLGILLFFPRFTLAWARLSTSGWLGKLLRR